MTATQQGQELPPGTFDERLQHIQTQQNQPQTTRRAEQPVSQPKTAGELQMRAALAKKILTVTHEIGVLYKDGKNEQQRYDFLSYELINTKLGDILPRIGLALMPTITSIEERDLVNKSGSPYTRTVIRGEMLVIDCDTGYSMRFAFCGGENDNGGKSSGKAITESIKRFEMKLFHLSTKEDIDPDAQTYPYDGYPPQGQPQQYAPAPQQYQQPQGYYR